VAACLRVRTGSGKERSEQVRSRASVLNRGCSGVRTAAFGVLVLRDPRLISSGGCASAGSRRGRDDENGCLRGGVLRLRDAATVGVLGCGSLIRGQGHARRICFGGLTKENRIALPAMTEVRVVPPLRNQLRPGRQRFGFGGFPRPVRVVSLPRVSAGRDGENCRVYTEPGRLYEASGASPPRCVTRGSQAPSAWRLLIFLNKCGLNMGTLITIPRIGPRMTISVVEKKISHPRAGAAVTRGPT
jgi:hypothetical protein